MGDLGSNMWLIWLGIMVLLALLEVASLDFFFSMLAGGALAAAGSAGLDHSIPIQVLVFAIVSALLLITLRPGLRRWVKRSVPMVPTNVDALVGQLADVLSEVTDRVGTVKLSGETWSARAAETGAVHPVGARVRVVRIDGATAVVAALAQD